MRTIILKATSRHIPSGRHRINTEPGSSGNIGKDESTRRPRIQRSHLARPATDERRDHQNNKRRSEKHMETLDHKTDPSKLWRTVETIDGKSPPEAENKDITFDDSQVSSPKHIANYFSRQFTISKHGRHTSSCETRLVSRERKRKSLMSAVTFTTDQVIKGISNCSNTKAFGLDRLSIFHLNNLGPKAIEYLTALFNYSVTSCRIPAIWKLSIVIPISTPLL